MPTLKLCIALLITDRDKLLRRIRQIRRTNAVNDRPPGGTSELQPDRLDGLEGRIARLENQLEGLQDSVHRETARHAYLIAELQSQVDPGVVGVALAADARNRGL